MKTKIYNDLVDVADKIGHFPSRDDYIQLGRYSARAITKEFGSYGKLRALFMTNQMGGVVSKDVIKFEKEETNDSLNLVSESYEIRTVEQLLIHSEVNLDDFEVTKTVVNVWGSKDNPSYQVKAWLKKKTPDKVNATDLLKAFREKAEKYSPKYKTVKIPKTAKQRAACLQEISIQDIHYGQLSWKEETGKDNYDIKIAGDLMLEAVDFHLVSASDYNVEEVLFPVGSDFFNVNSALNTTVKGTIQDEDCRWQKSFHQGVMLLVACIDRILSNTSGKVHIPVIYGNHDHERTYYAGEFLVAWFKNNNRVIIDNQPVPRKYHQYHSNLIGYTHGDDIKADRLPLIMATESPDKWKQTKYREWHIGHLHHKKTHIYNTDLEENGVRVKTIPSLVAIDAWHNLKGYNAVRECPSFIWDKQKGNTAQFNFSV